MSARDARARAGRDRESVAGRRQQGIARTRNARPAAGRAGPAGAGALDRNPAASRDGLVVGAVPPRARVVGALLVLAGLAGAAGLLPTYLVVGGAAVAQAEGLGGFLAGVLVPLADTAVGVVLLRGAVPKFGLAYAGIAAALATGQLFIEIYRGSSSTARPGIEVLAGHLVLTSGVETGPGWVLAVAALALTVLAGALSFLAWGRTVMEDSGSLDSVRSVLAGAAVLLGVTTVLSLSLPAADVPDKIVSDPVTGLQTIVTREGPQALLERPGLALLGGLLLAGAVVLCSVIAPSLRPRLAAVGGLLAIAVTVLAAGFTGMRDATSPDLEWTLPGAGLVLAGAGYVVLTVAAWRLPRGRALR